MSTPMLDAALAEYEAGEAPFALPWGSKEPDHRWTYAQDRRLPLSSIRAMFSGGPHNLALIQGRPNGGFALDCDNPDEYHTIYNLLWGSNVKPRIIRRPATGSDHDGGGTFCLKATWPVKSGSVTIAEGITVEVRGQGEYTLAPGSLHPEGVQYYESFRPDEYTTLHLLHQGSGYVVDGLPALKFTPAAEPRSRLSRKAWRLLTGDPATLAHYPTRSEAEAALCASLYRSGRTYDDALLLFREHVCAGKYAQLEHADPDNAQRWLYMTWANVKEWVDLNESPATTRAAQLAEEALEQPWPGRTGATDRAVWLAHLEIIERCGRFEYAASCRELAELAGVDKMTAARATHRLRERGLITITKTSEPSLAKRYKIEGGLSDTLNHTQDVMECITKSLAQHDAFRWGGLGKPGAEVWYALDVGKAQTITELAGVTSRHPRTVRRKLYILRDLGMVTENELTHEWALTVDADLEIVARELGTAGASAKQRRRHAQQRATHDRALERGKWGSK